MNKNEGSRYRCGRKWGDLRKKKSTLKKPHAAQALRKGGKLRSQKTRIQLWVIFPLGRYFFKSRGGNESLHHGPKVVNCVGVQGRGGLMITFAA